MSDNIKVLKSQVRVLKEELLELKKKFAVQTEINYMAHTQFTILNEEVESLKKQMITLKEEKE